MNKYIIADSSGLISLLARDDSNHLKAVNFSKEIANNDNLILVPGEVFSETMNILGKKVDKKTAHQMGNSILISAEFNFTESIQTIHEEALKKFIKLTKSASYTDCLVMAFADEFDTKVIFGFDKVFGQNGYILPGK